MLATRWNPLMDIDGELSRMRTEMDRLFGRGNGLVSAGTGLYPPLNVWQDQDHLYVEAELPGFDREKLELYVTGGNQLTIKGERQQPQLQTGAWHRRERGYGEFHRTIELPADVNSEQVTAEYKDGVLTVKLPKSDAVKPRRIEVTSS